MGEVMKAAGLTHGAFYAHFGSKEELQAAAVAYGQKVSLGRLQRGKEKTKGRFDDRYLSTWHRDNPADGWTMAPLGPEVARSAPELKAAFERGLEGILSARGGIGMKRSFRLPRRWVPLFWLVPCRSAALGQNP